MNKPFKKLREKLAAPVPPFWMTRGIAGYVGPHHFGNGDLCAREALANAVGERAGRRLHRIGAVLITPLIALVFLDGKLNSLDLKAGFWGAIVWLSLSLPRQHQIKAPEPAHVQGALHFVMTSAGRRAAKRDVLKILPSLLSTVENSTDLDPEQWEWLLEQSKHSRKVDFRIAVLNAMCRAGAPQLAELVNVHYRGIGLNSQKLRHDEASAVAAARYALRADAVIRAESAPKEGDQLD